MKWFDPTGATRSVPAPPRGTEGEGERTIRITEPPPVFRWLSRPLCSAWGYLPGLLGLTQGAPGIAEKPRPPENFRP